MSSQPSSQPSGALPQMLQQQSTMLPPGTQPSGALPGDTAGIKQEAGSSAPPPTTIKLEAGQDASAQPSTTTTTTATAGAPNDPNQQQQQQPQQAQQAATVIKTEEVPQPTGAVAATASDAGAVTTDNGSGAGQMEVDGEQPTAAQPPQPNQPPESAAAAAAAAAAGGEGQQPAEAGATATAGGGGDGAATVAAAAAAGGEGAATAATDGAAAAPGGPPAQPPAGTPAASEQPPAASGQPPQPAPSGPAAATSTGAPQQPGGSSQPQSQSQQQVPGLDTAQGDGGAGGGGSGGGGGDGQGGGGGSSLTVRREDVSAEVLQLVQQHTDFLKAQGNLRVRDMMMAVREYLHADTPMAYHLWVLMFPIVWATLEKAQQVQLAKPLISLLSKEWHQRQTALRPNIIQALLDGIAVCQPQPKIPPELIKFLGKSYNAWQIAIPLLESHCVMFPQDTRCFDALGQLYHLVSEEDMLYGLWRKRCQSEVTRTSLWLLQTGHMETAEELLGGASRMALINGVQVPRGEAALWVEQWVGASKTLNHWEALAEYARSTEQTELAVEAAWRMHDWAWLKESLSSGRLSSDEAGAPTLLARAYLALQEGDLQAADARISHASIAAMLRWWQLPEVGTAPQVPLLQQFQQLVELRESVRILGEVNAPPRVDMMPAANDTRELTSTWRARTPNEWENLVHWQDVLVWRSFIYNHIIKAYAHLAEANPSLHQLGYKDKAWAVNKLGSVATLHSLPDTCLQVLNTMYGFNAMEVQEAFVKIREQARAYLDKPNDLVAGLNLLSTTNLDYFQPHHQCELYRLKGSILAAIKDVDAAHAAYSTALHLCRTSAESWVSWSQLCDEQWEASLSAGNPQPQLLEYSVHSVVQGVRLGAASARALLPRLLCQLSFDNDHTPSAQKQQQANPAMPPPPGWTNVVGSTMVRSGGHDLPVWVWLAWLPQLIMGLPRPESATIRSILQQLAAAAPQAIFYPLRVFLLALREALGRLHAEMKQRQALAQAAQQTAQAAHAKFLALQQAATEAGNTFTPESNPEAAAALQAVRAAQREQQAHALALQQLDQGRQVEAGAFETGREINEVMRSKWPALASTLEVLVTELGARFSPRQEERLLAVVAALLHRCYKVAYASQAEVPLLMKKELAGVCKACFKEGSSAAAEAAAAGARGKRSVLATTMREQFVVDMNPESPSFPATLGDLMEHLKAWRARLLSELEDRMPSTLRLEEEAPALAELCLADVEMPGAYSALLGGGDPPPGLLAPLGAGSGAGDPGVVMLESIGSAVQIIRRQGNGHRRLALHGSDGRVRHVVLQQNVNWPQHMSDERLVQLLRSFNRLLDQQPTSRSRNLGWYTPALLPVHTSVRLAEEDPGFTPYVEAYDVNCMRYGREADIPIVHFKKRCANAATGALINDPTQGPHLRQLAFTEICDKLVTENVFSQYVYKTLPTCNHLWVFKKTFCAQSALSGLLCHLLYLGGRAPAKILFAKDTGRVHQLELMTVYSDKGLLDKQEAVPLRLTRNMSTFFTAFGVEGIFLVAMVNAAQAILHKGGNAAALLALFFRDDITMWTSRRNAKAMLSSVLKPEVLKALVATNAHKALERLRGVSPVPVYSVDEALPHLLTGAARCMVAMGAQRLVEAAMDPVLLSRMEPTWHPWF